MPTDRINKVVIIVNGTRLSPIDLNNTELSRLFAAASAKRSNLIAFGTTFVRPSSIDAIEVSNA